MNPAKLLSGEPSWRTQRARSLQHALRFLQLLHRSWIMALSVACLLQAKRLADSAGGDLRHALEVLQLLSMGRPLNRAANLGNRGKKVRSFAAQRPVSPSLLFIGMTGLCEAPVAALFKQASVQMHPGLSTRCLFAVSSACRHSGRAAMRFDNMHEACRSTSCLCMLHTPRMTSLFLAQITPFVGDSEEGQSCEGG